MKTIQDVRKAIAPLGFNIRTTSFSAGKFATWLKGREKMPSIFTAAELKTWQPLLNWIKNNQVALGDVKRNTGCYGLVQKFK
jgi:hypothetical protein